MHPDEGRENQTIKEIKGVSRCNLKDVQYVDFGCRDSVLY